MPLFRMIINLKLFYFYISLCEKYLYLCNVLMTTQSLKYCLTLILLYYESREFKKSFLPLW